MTFAAPERILHRSNTLKRINEGIAKDIARFEIDLWYCGGVFALRHDRQVGNLLVGRHGVEFTHKKKLPLHRSDTIVTLTELLGAFAEPLPILLDLKGRWGRESLADLLYLLKNSGWDKEAFIASENWAALDFCRQKAPSQKLIYFDGIRERGAPLFRRLRRGEWIFGTTIRAAEFNPYRSILRNMQYAARFGKLHIILWDIPDLETYQQLKTEPVDGLIIDNPTWK